MKIIDLLKRNKVITTAVLGALVVGVLFILSKNKRTPIEATTVKKDVFVGSIRADGRLQAKTKITVIAFADGDLSHVSIKVGETLRKGQTFARLIWDEDRAVKSPIDGIVTKVFRDSPGPIRRGEPILEVADATALEAVTELLTSDAVRIRSGMPATISGFGENAKINGKVKRISRAGFKKISALGVEEERTEVLIELPQSPVLEKLGDNFHVETEIETERVEGALVLPIGALIRTNEHWSVFAIEKQRALLKPIQVLGQNGAMAAIEGLPEGTQVVMYPPDSLKDQGRVKVIKQR